MTCGVPYAGKQTSTIIWASSNHGWATDLRAGMNPNVKLLIQFSAGFARCAHTGRVRPVSPLMFQLLTIGRGRQKIRGKVRVNLKSVSVGLVWGWFGGWFGVARVLLIRVLLWAKRDSHRPAGPAAPPRGPAAVDHLVNQQRAKSQ